MKVIVKACSGIWEKTIGLIGKKRCQIPLLLMSCNRIHTYFMRFSVDVVYLSQDYVILAVEESIDPWKLGMLVDGCNHVLEMEAGTSKDYQVGKKLEFDFMNKK